jgi:hypothetical protein
MRYSPTTLYSLEQAMKNHLPMFSFVLGINYLLSDSNAIGALLAATGDEIEDVLRANKDWMFAMCPECQQFRGQVNPNLLDLAMYLRENPKKLGIM